MFYTYETKRHEPPKQVFEMEDIEIEEDNNVVPARPAVAPLTQNPVQYHIDKKSKKHINAAAIMITSEKPKVKTEQKPAPPEISTPIQMDDSPVKVTIQRPDTDLKIISPKKPKFQGRLLGNLSSLTAAISSNNENPINIPERKRPAAMQNNLKESDSSGQIKEIVAPRIPKRKMAEQSPEVFENQDISNIPDAHQKPRGRLLGSLM